MDKETARQLFHIGIGICAIALLLLWDRGALIAGVFLTILIGLWLMNIRLLGGRVPLVAWFEERFEREDAPLPGWGSACYAAGVLLTATFLHDPMRIAAVLVCLAIGDGVSTLVGLRGRIRIPYNKRKTLEGSLALFIASLPAYAFIGPLAIPLALVAAVAESVPVIDDNISIPVLCTALLLVL